jgi:demethylspheroidene O-methyltransferase
VGRARRDDAQPRRVAVLAPLIERWYRWRDGRLRDPAFQRFAARFPLTRGMARRRSLELFDLVAGFVYSQVLFALVQLRLLEAVGDGPLPLERLAALAGLRLEPMHRLCEAGVALRLLSRRGGERYGLGDLGAALLGNPGVSAMIEHHSLLYLDLQDPVALLRDPQRPTELAAFWAYARNPAPGALGPEQVAAYSRLMGVSQDFIAGEILDAYPVGRHRCLLDVGGGEGAFVRAAAGRAPGLQFLLFDLPAVAQRATQTFEAALLADRARAVGGDLFADSLPRGADIACLIRVLYDHPRERALAILRAVHAALPLGGTLLVAEPMAQTSGAERVGAAYFAFYLLAMRGGEARSATEIAALLQEAGFVAIEPVATRRPLLTSLIRARR